MLNTSDIKTKLEAILRSRSRRILKDTARKPSAVLIPVYSPDLDPLIILTRRSRQVQYHKGEICFPGGGYHEEDNSLLNTALRESFEEIGLKSSGVDIIGELDDMFTNTSGYIITPFIGLVSKRQDFVVNPFEIDELLQIPVTALLEKGCLVSGETITNGGVPFTPHVFSYKSYKITGATAGILKQFLEIWGTVIS